MDLTLSAERKIMCLPSVRFTAAGGVEVGVGCAHQYGNLKLCRISSCHNGSKNSKNSLIKMVHRPLLALSKDGRIDTNSICDISNQINVRFLP